ncbi:MAG: radical SAM protein, partial [Chitinivibrionales bacterium]|nr:radical SAM protein [Chitinivibrionales bacterium]MBD3394749.1 radical SAM protein [Chitinivibrionales bacterium]
MQPQHLVLFVGRRCNLRCPNCLWVLEDSNFFGGEDLSLDAAKEIAAYYRRKGAQSIYLQSEGEILLYDHLRELYRYCRHELGYKMETIVTNGILLDAFEDVILREMGPQVILVSLDGYDPETYRQRRGVGEKTFNRILENVKRLAHKARELNAPIRVNLNCIVGRWNYRYIKPMLALARSIGGIGSMSFGNFHPVGEDCELRPLDKGDAEVVSYLREIISRNDYSMDIVLPSLYGRRNRFVCEMLFDTVLVGNEGNFAPCCHISTARR